MKNVLTAVTAVFFCLLAGCDDKKNPMPVSSAGPFWKEIKDSKGYNFLLFLPANDAEAINGKYPTILFLHGIGESGSDLQLLKRGGFPKNLEGDRTFPFIFIMPQCPSNTEWYYENVDNVRAINLLLDDVISRYPVDTNRVYITGLSMGGIGAWYFAIKCPNRFAALAPVAFRGDGWSPCGIKHLPVWAFHGAQDQIIPLAKAEELASEFKRCGGSMKFTVYPDRGHDAWTFAYNNSELYTWLLQHRK